MKALFKKIKWQQQKLTHELFMTTQHLESITQDLHAAMNKMSVPILILPEMEMARMNYIIQKQQQHDELTIRKTVLLAEQTRLNIDQNLLEKHQHTKVENQRLRAKQVQQNTMDEWVLQR